MRERFPSEVEGRRAAAFLCWLVGVLVAGTVEAAPCTAVHWAADGGIACGEAPKPPKPQPKNAIPRAAFDENAPEPVVADAADAGTAAEPAVEAFTPVEGVEAFEAPASGPTVQVSAHVGGAAAVDTQWESPRRAELAEHVWDLQLRARVAADVKLSPSLRLFVEGKAWFRAGSERDFDRTKGVFEPMLGEAYFDLYSKYVDVRVGNQRIVMGANAALAPADALNPKDYRTGLLSLDPDDGVLPTFALRARGELGRVGWMVAYAPFFTPSRFVLFGQDEGLLQPALAPALPTRRIEPTQEDYVQERLIETKRPHALAGDVAVRVVSTGKYKIGASWAWINEKLPQVVIDPELQSLLESQSAGKMVNPATAVSVQQRLAANDPKDPLFTGVYARQHVFSLEGSTLIGPGQLDVDVSYSPRQTFFDAQFAPIDKSAITWVVGYSTAEDSKLVWAVSYLGMAVPDVVAKEQIILLEPATAVGADRIAWFHLFAGNVGYTLWEDRFVLELSAVFEPIQRSVSLVPRVTYQGVEGLKLWVGAQFFEGGPYSPLGYFGRNDQVMVGARYEVF